MTQIYLLAIIAAAAFAAGSGAGWKLRDLSADAELSKAQAACQARESAWERAARESEARQRAIEQGRIAAAAKEVEDARTDAAMDAKRAADLGAANRRLLDRVAALAALADSRSSDPPAAAGSAPAAGPGLVLAQLYRGADEEARELAASFDAARRAGLTCERVYDGLIHNQH